MTMPIFSRFRSGVWLGRIICGKSGHSDAGDVEMADNSHVMTVFTR
jgi:hypothetical protein